MTTAKSFNSSLENIAGRIFVVPKVVIFGANGCCGNFEYARGLCVLGHRFVSCLAVGCTDGRASNTLT